MRPGRSNEVAVFSLKGVSETSEESSKGCFGKRSQNFLESLPFVRVDKEDGANTSMQLR
jgi:hypothetical protein